MTGYIHLGWVVCMGYQYSFIFTKQTWKIGKGIALVVDVHKLHYVHVGQCFPIGSLRYRIGQFVDKPVFYTLILLCTFRLVALEVEYHREERLHTFLLSYFGHVCIGRQEMDDVGILLALVPPAGKLNVYAEFTDLLLQLQGVCGFTTRREVRTGVVVN